MVEVTEVRGWTLVSSFRGRKGLLRSALAWPALLVSASALVSGCGRPAPQGPQPGAGTGPQSTTGGDSPQISRSVGVEGGVVVLWPRVIGSPDAGLPITSVARELQSRLVAITKRVAPGRPVDVRPEPERVCPRAGCAATSVGVLLAVRGRGCAAVALVSEPGQSPAELVPWGGGVNLKSSSALFREPPEQSVSVSDYARCESLLEELSDQDVEAAIQRKLK